MCWRIFVGFFFLCIAVLVCSENQQIIDVIDDNVKCGPIMCPLNEAHMCFYTSKFNIDTNNVSFITSCGTCLSINGSVIRENCDTVSSKLTNYTNRMSINLLDSTLDSTRIRNAVIGIMLSEMGRQSSIPYTPSVQVTTPSSAFLPAPQQQQPIVVVQPPAQYITVNSVPPYQTGYMPPRSMENAPTDNNICVPPCQPKKPLIQNSISNRPNQLPPQVDKIYRLIAGMKGELNQIDDLIADAVAGGRIGYLDDRPYPKTPFPVWTPVR